MHWAYTIRKTERKKERNNIHTTQTDTQHIRSKTKTCNTRLCIHIHIRLLLYTVCYAYTYTEAYGAIKCKFIRTTTTTTCRSLSVCVQQQTAAAAYCVTNKTLKWNWLCVFAVHKLEFIIENGLCHHLIVFIWRFVKKIDTQNIYIRYKIYVTYSYLYVRHRVECKGVGVDREQKETQTR